MTPLAPWEEPDHLKAEILRALRASGSIPRRPTVTLSRQCPLVFAEAIASAGYPIRFYAPLDPGLKP